MVPSVMKKNVMKILCNTIFLNIETIYLRPYYILEKPKKIICCNLDVYILICNIFNILSILNLYIFP